MESPEHQRRAVTDYVELETEDDEHVEHAEKISSERLFGRQHDVWDVRTNKGRWWVVTEPTNLYHQEDFKSMDYVLSFHVGVTARVFAKQSREAPEGIEPRLGRTRRQWEQAAEALNEADEAEEFQAVGLRCRETLVSFAHAMASDDLVPKGIEKPKASDFIHWIELVANAVAPGRRHAALRSYLKSLAKETWDYVAWLTHEKNAVRVDGELAVDLTAHFLGVFELVIGRQEMGVPDKCPECDSYRVIADWHYDKENDQGIRAQICEACGWHHELEPESLHWAHEDPVAGS